MQPAWRPLPVAADGVAAMSPVPLTPLVAALAPLPFSTVAFGNGDPALSTQSATGTPDPPHPAPSHHPTSGKWQRVELASGTGPRLAFRHHELVENAKPGGTWEWQPSSSGAQLAGSESHVPPPPRSAHTSQRLIQLGSLRASHVVPEPWEQLRTQHVNSGYPRVS